MRLSMIIKFLFAMIFLLFIFAFLLLQFLTEETNNSKDFFGETLQDSSRKINNYSLIDFEYNNYQSITTLTKLPDLSEEQSSCIPMGQGVTNEEAKKYMQYRKYDPCTFSDKTDVINQRPKSIYMNCGNKNLNAYSLDFGGPEIFGDGELNFTWTSVSAPVTIDIGDSQYLFIKCSKRIIYSFVFNHFDPGISKKAQDRRKEIEKSLGLNSTRPLTIQILVFDSLSRQNFYRTQPNTIEFLNSSVIKGKYSEKVSLYDFWLTNTIDIFTKANMIPVIYGQDYQKLEEYINKYNTSNHIPESVYLNLQENAIWKELSHLGYVTMFGYDTIWNFMNTVTGKIISTDYSFLNFWKAAKKIYGYNDFADKSRCLGNRNSHWYLMDYNLQFIKNYQGHNRFGYVHLSPGHESSGVIKTADLDIKEYLEQFLEHFSQHPEEDFFLILMSDHGRGVGRLEFFTDFFTELRLPVTMFMANKEFISRIGAGKRLEINGKRFIGRYDLHLTLKTLGLSPYGKLKQRDYEELKKNYTVNEPVSLIMEEANRNRNCSNIGVKDISCICKKFSPVDLNDELHSIAFQLLEEMAVASIEKMISRMYGCKILEFYKVLNLSVFEIGDFLQGSSRIYKAHIHTPTMVIQITGNLASNERIIETRSRLENLDNMNSLKLFTYKDQEMLIQVAKIDVIDSECSTLSNCLCNNNWTILSRPQKETCNYICESNNMKCGISKYLYISCEEYEVGNCICY